MIISEKQIMQLIFMAKAYEEELRKSQNDIDRLAAEAVSNFLFTVSYQQPDELKVVE
jgi:hypothetical protein